MRVLLLGATGTIGRAVLHALIARGHEVVALARPETSAAKVAQLGATVVHGDIGTPAEARAVLARTGADGLMIGRAAFGRPWIFREIAHFLATGEELAPPAPQEVAAVVREHLEGLYALYGEAQGLRVARKHLGWYARRLPGGEAFRQPVVRLECAARQRAAVNDYFERLAA